MKGEDVWRCDASLVQNKTMKMSEKKSNFWVTCSRLSQYLKREGSFKELKLDMASTSQTQQQPIQGAYRPPTTMSLLPGLDVSVEKQPDTTESDKSVMKSMEFFPQHTGFGSTDEKTDTKEPENAQLTIFYNGKVMVFDNLPVHKAQDLLQLAAKESLITNSATQTTTVADHLFVNCPATSDSEPMAPQSNPSESMRRHHICSSNYILKKIRGHHIKRMPVLHDRVVQANPKRLHGGLVWVRILAQRRGDRRSYI